LFEQVQPFIKWPGGKRKLAVQILRRLPAGESYIEPFLGAGAVALEAMVQHDFRRYLLSDADECLIRTWRAVRDNAEGVLGHYSRLLEERTEVNPAAHYYDVRGRFNAVEPHTPDHIVAGMLLYLNAHTFNGLYRRNKNGEFNAPYGHITKEKTLPIRLLRKVSELLNARNVVFTCNDFRQVDVPLGSVGYYDPPYWPRQGNGFTAYTGDGFSVQDQADLAEHFKAQEGFCLQTNGPGAEHLYDGCTIEPLWEDTVISRRGEDRGAARTLLISQLGRRST
jgi:DNA adenine methylase